jgi:hypothetical protein
VNEFPDEPQLAEAREVHLHVDRPKVKLIRNAKGDPQWEISAVEGTDDTVLDALRASAVRQYLALERELLGLER